MPLPRPVEAGVRRALRERGLGTRIESVMPVGGGCINNGARLETDTGVTLFLKWNPAAPSGMFESEAGGLTALAEPDRVRVPRPLAWESESAAGGWLLLEYVGSGEPTRDTDAELGRGLAAIHASCVDDAFGWDRDNWIGSLPQDNTESMHWGEFWRDERIVPQLDMARGGGYLTDPLLDRLVDVIPQGLDDVGRPELLHGDLWSGNWFADREHRPVLIDPAVYRGHGEVDLAMTELFGGFGPGFYDAYAESNGVSNAYVAYRRDLYQLYYLLVHVNLFGASYAARSLAAARRVVTELGA